MIGRIRHLLNLARDEVRVMRYFWRFRSKLDFDRIRWVLETTEFDHGHLESFRQWQSIDREGNEIPWYTYPSIEYLNQLDFRDKRLFEFGSGNSSTYWAGRCKHLTSVESNAEWHQKVQEKLAGNQELILATTEEAYVSAIDREENNYDIIIIDGEWRYACANRAIRWLAPDGLVILDNSDWFPKTAEFLRQQDLIQVDFKGLGPINYYTWTTSLFFRRSVVLRPLQPHQPDHGIGSIKQVIEPE